jgi:poly(3-hydroxybutyrate) depolymerase
MISEDGNLTNPQSHVFTYNSEDTVKYRNDITVSNDNLISYDIYYDDFVDELKPVVIWVHGGGWSIGKKRNLQHKKAYFESLGYVLVSINYRLSSADENDLPHDFANPNRIKFPTHPDDVANAVSSIYREIHNYNGDKNNMVILGHSAGAHIAMLIATDPSYLENYGLHPKNVFKGVANFDTEAYDITRHFHDKQVTTNNDTESFPTYQNATTIAQNYTTAYNINPGLNGFTKTVITYLNAFGTNYTDWQNASPINHLNHNDKPNKFFIYYQGDSGTQRRDLIRDFVTTLNSGATQVISGETIGQSHDQINTNIGVPNNDMTTELTLFLEDCFN